MRAETMTAALWAEARSAAAIRDAVHRAQQPSAAPIPALQPPAPLERDLIDYAVVRQLHKAVHDELATLLREQGEVTAEYRRAEGERLVTQHVTAWVDAQRRLREVTDDEEEELLDAVLAEVVGLGRLQPLLDNPAIENITILGHDHVRIEYREGAGVGYGKPVADSDEHLIRLVQNLARQGTAIGTTERSLSPSKPMLDMQLPDGSRLTVVYQVSQSPVVVIRRHGVIDLTLDDLAGPKYNMIDPVLADFLRAVVNSNGNVMIAGAGGSGKTTLLRGLGSCIPSDEWFVVMEESRELGFHLTGKHPWAVSLEAREGHGGTGPDGRPIGELRLGTMFPITQRLNTQRVIVGEVRDEEIIAALQAMSTTGGSFCTIHARHPDLVFDRVVELALKHRNENSVERAYRQVAGAIDYIVYVQTRNQKKNRFVSHVLELNGVVDGQVKYTTVFGPGPDGRAVPMHLPERHREDLLEAGYDMSDLNRYRGAGRWPRELNGNRR